MERKKSVIVVENVDLLMNIKLKKLMFLIIFMVLMISVFSGCANDLKYTCKYCGTEMQNYYSYHDGYICYSCDKEYFKSTYETTTRQNNYSSKNISHYCQTDGCIREGTKKFTGFSGETEYYCYTHYNEILGILGDIEEDVGKSQYSKHTCEECSREGTYSLIGFSGKTEYYCTTHYYEMKELLDYILN